MNKLKQILEFIRALLFLSEYVILFTQAA